MGLDVALGLLVLVAGVRGWLRGFVSQAIRLGGIVLAVYAAASLRDYARPYALEYLSTVKPEFLERLLWWASAVFLYVASTGLAGLAVKLYRRRTFDLFEPNRADQIGGFLVGAMKGLIVASFLVAGLNRYGLERLKEVEWLSEQTRDSQSLAWHKEYRPAERIWSAAPVRHFVGHVRRMGLEDATTESTAAPVKGEEPSAQAAATRPPRLNLPGLGSLDPASPDFDEKLEAAIRSLEAVE